MSAPCNGGILCPAQTHDPDCKSQNTAGFLAWARSSGPDRSEWVITRAEARSLIQYLSGSNRGD